MLLNLTESVELKEICKMSVIGHNSEKAEFIMLELSQEALLGFATELIWLYEDMESGEKIVISTHRLGVDPAARETLGFYLTPNSPMFVLKVNYLSEEVTKDINYKEINIRRKNANQYYNVKQPDEEARLEQEGFVCVEPYELSRKNIMNIRLLDKHKKDIVSNYGMVFFEINYNGIKEFATMLMVLANNYREGQEYQLAHVNQVQCGYNLGVILIHDSTQAIIKCADLGISYDYDPKIC